MHIDPFLILNAEDIDTTEDITEHIEELAEHKEDQEEIGEELV